MEADLPESTSLTDRASTIASGAQAAARRLHRNGRIAGWLSLGGLAWMVYAKNSGGAIFVDAALVALLHGFQLWTASKGFMRNWSDPGYWMLLCITFSAPFGFSVMLHFSPHNSAGTVSSLNTIMAASIAGWCAHSLISPIVWNFRLSRSAGATFGSLRRRG